jgi:prepilin-type N-terminal cleavage/methylation domain-containing protein
MSRKANSNTGEAMRQRGFSAIEMLLAVVLLTAVLGIVVKGMTEMQRRSSAESSKTDAVQDARVFIDQMVRDIHATGYPPPRAFSLIPGTANPNNSPYCTDALGNGIPNVAMRDNPNVACGVVQYSPTRVVYEGDFDGTGVVQTAVLQLIVGANGSCPCTLQRGVVTKALWLAGNQPLYFTTIDGVLNSGNGAQPTPATTFGVLMNGVGNYTAYANADVFDGYDNSATLITAPCSLGEINTGVISNPDCTQIRSLQITVNVAPAYADPVTKMFPVYSITSKARVNF